MGAQDTLALDEAFTQDPHRFYVHLREEAPVRRVTMMRGLTGWLVTRYDDVRAALADPRLRKDADRARELMQAQFEDRGESRSAFDASLSSHMLNSDPPDHTRLRKLVNKAFTSRTVARLRPRIEEITDELLDAHGRPGDGRPAGRVRVPAADHRDLRAARRAAGGPRRLPVVVEHPVVLGRARPDSRGRREHGRLPAQAGRGRSAPSRPRTC